MGWAATHTFSVGETLSAANLNLIQNNINAGMVVGKLSYVCALTAGAATEYIWQTGWLECNGAAVSRSTYATLYNYFVTLTPTLPYGVGNGSTTFNLPDMRGRVPIHHGAHTDIATFGANDGVTDANRRPKHRTSNALTGTYSGTTAGPNFAVDTADGGGTGVPFGSGAASDSLSTTHTHTYAGSVTFGGSIGSNNANDSLDASPYLVAGIWVVKF